MPSFISKVELKYQLQRMGIKVEGNYVKKGDIEKILGARSVKNRDPLPSSSVLEKLKPTLIREAQREYDKWSKAEKEHNALYTKGDGLCDHIVDAFESILNSNKIPAIHRSQKNHASTLVCCIDGVFDIDIPYELYEKFDAGHWLVIEDVKFTVSNIVIKKISEYPDKFEDFLPHGHFFNEMKIWKGIPKN